VRGYYARGSAQENMVKNVEEGSPSNSVAQENKISGLA